MSKSSLSATFLFPILLLLIGCGQSPDDLIGNWGYSVERTRPFLSDTGLVEIKTGQVDHSELVFTKDSVSRFNYPFWHETTSSYLATNDSIYFGVKDSAEGMGYIIEGDSLHFLLQNGQKPLFDFKRTPLNEHVLKELRQHRYNRDSLMGNWVCTDYWNYFDFYGCDTIGRTKFVDMTFSLNDSVLINTNYYPITYSKGGFTIGGYDYEIWKFDETILHLSLHPHDSICESYAVILERKILDY